MTPERGPTRRALPWIVLALLMTATVLLWRGGSAPGDDALAPHAPSAPSIEAAADTSMPARQTAPAREEPQAAPKVKSRSRSGPPAPAAPVQLLTGVTVDEARRPLGGVHVELVWQLGTRARGEGMIRHDCLSDAEGRFALETFDGASTALELRAWRKTYDLLESSPLQRDDSGAWRPVEVVLTPCARIGLTVQDARGAPVEGLAVHVALAPVEEPTVQAGLAVLAPRYAHARARTDAEGHVELRISARRLLELVLTHEDWELATDRVREDELAFDRRGEALVLAPGEERELVARLGDSLVIEGTVTHADGTAVDDGRIRLFDGDPALVGLFESRMELQLDDAGRFRFELHDLAPDARLSVLAVDGFWFTLRDDNELRKLVSREVRLEEAVDGVITLALVVESLLELQGRALDAGGANFPGTIWAVPAGAEYLLQKGPHGLLPITLLDVDKGGEFTIAGLLPGEYDLILKRGEPRTYHRFDGYTAGQRGIELRIEDDREVTIRLRCDGGEAGTRIEPVLLTHHFRRPSEHARVATPTRVRVDGCERARWPERLGFSSVEGPTGRVISLAGEPRVSNEHRFEPQQAGWYSVGARAWDAADRAYLRRLSEPVWLERGEYEFVIELVPTTRLVGVARAGESVEVLDAAGERVPHTADRPFAQADGRGAFVFEEVPVGALRVRVGTLEQLERGQPRMELAAQASRGVELNLGFE